MSPKIVSGDSTHRDFHPSLYEDNHRDHYFTFLPFLKPFPFLAIPNASVWWDPILGSKVRYPLLGIY